VRWYLLNKAPIIQKDNILLRSPNETDIVSRFNLGLDYECEKMCGREVNLKSEYSITDAQAWYDKIQSHSCKWIIEYNKEMVGIIGLTPYLHDNKGRLSIEIYKQSARGKGIGTKAIKLVIKYAFEDLKYHKVYLRVLDINTNAIKCYEKCGFKREGIDREGALINGVYHSDIYMGILISDYLENNL
jgi:RimJ/RimL family protein N-acetyltransferase